MNVDDKNLLVHNVKRHRSHAARWILTETEIVDAVLRIGLASWLANLTNEETQTEVELFGTTLQRVELEEFDGTASLDGGACHRRLLQIGVTLPDPVPPGVDTVRVL